jgi:RNA polymerase sigma-70 factor (ECF subfamily)
VFALEFDEIGRALDRSPAACRKLASRAREHVRDARPRYAVPPEEGARVAEAFRVAAREGDVAALSSLLAESATLVSDGGGKRHAALRPIVGAERIGRFFEGLARKGWTRDPRWVLPARINGLPGWASREADGTLQTVALELEDGRVAAIYVTRNPDKLRHLAYLESSGQG